MPKKRYRPEGIVAKLRQVDVLVSQGQNVADAIRQIGVSELTYYRWRQEYGRAQDRAGEALLLLSEVSTRLRHDGIRRIGWSHLSRAVAWGAARVSSVSPDPVVLAGRPLHRGGVELADLLDRAVGAVLRKVVSSRHMR